MAVNPLQELRDALLEIVEATAETAEELGRQTTVDPAEVSALGGEMRQAAQRIRDLIPDTPVTPPPPPGPTA